METHKEKETKVVLLEVDDWQMLYINGKLVEEYHTIGRALGMSEYKAWDLLSKKYNFDIQKVSEYYIDNISPDGKYINDFGSGKDYLSEYLEAYE